MKDDVLVNMLRTPLYRPSLSYSILNKSGTCYVGLLVRWKLRSYRLEKVEGYMRG
jgi:hypothetical protein